MVAPESRNATGRRPAVLAQSSQLSCCRPRVCPHGSSSCRGCCCFATRRRAHAVRHARTWSPARVATPALRSHEEEHVGDRAAEERQRHHAVHLVAARCIFAISEACVADIKRAICAAGRNWSSGHGHSNAELLPPFISNAPPSMDAGTVYKVYMGRHVHFPWCNQQRSSAATIYY